jgi:hypothetical protein
MMVAVKIALRPNVLTTMTTKHFLNDPSTLVIDSLRGSELVNPHIRVDIKHKGWVRNLLMVIIE